MRLIDPIRLKQALAVSAILEDKKTIEQIIDEQPTIEQPEIITCKDCIWWTKHKDSQQGRCARYGFYPTGYWYCAGAKERLE